MAGKDEQNRKLVILAGPSCVGKGAIRRALPVEYPDLNYAEARVCVSRPPRYKKELGRSEIHGLDYFFLPPGAFARLPPDCYISAAVGSGSHAIDLEEIRALVKRNTLVLVEAYYELALRLAEWAREELEKEIEVVTIFLTPLCRDEIDAQCSATGKSPVQVVYEIMKEKLLARKEDTLGSIEARASHAYKEIESSVEFDHVIVNHVGEGEIDNWTPPLTGEAREVLQTFVSLFSH